MYDYTGLYPVRTLVTVYVTVETDVDCAACNAFSNHGNAGCAKRADDWSARQATAAYQRTYAVQPAG